MERQIIEMKQRLAEKDRTAEVRQERLNERETTCKVDERDEIMSHLRQTFDCGNEEIEKMRQTITQLQKNLSESENQLCINKQLSNFMKMRRLKFLAEKSVETEELLNKLKKERANIAEWLKFGRISQLVSSDAAMSKSPDRLLKGKFAQFFSDML